MVVYAQSRPETLVRWHRAGFRRYWRWKSRSLGGRPRIAADLRALIRRMSAENPLWGATKYAIYYNELEDSSVSQQRPLRSVAPSSTWTASDLHPFPAALLR